MKKLTLILTIILLSLALAACNDKSAEIQEENITIIDLSNNETIKTISETEEIESFVLSLALEDWTMSKLPEQAEAQAKFILNIQETVKLGQSEDDVKSITGAELTTYRDSDYVTINLAGFDLTFQAPGASIDYLNSFLPQEEAN